MKNLNNLIKKLFKRKLFIIPGIILVLFVCIVACTSESVSETPTTNKYSNVPQDQTVSFKTTPYIVGNEQGMLSGIWKPTKNVTKVVSFSTPRVMYLPKDHPRYDELYNRLLLPEGADSNFVELVIGDWSEEHGHPVIDVKELSKEEKERLIQYYKEMEVTSDLEDETSL